MAGVLRRRMAWTALLRLFKPGTPGLGRRLAAIPRMIGATMRGEYDGKGRLTMMTVAGLYILSPIDLIPEAFFLILGLVDDAAVAAWFAGALLDETERFLEWERRRAMVIPGQMVSGGYPHHPQYAPPGAYPHHPQAVPPGAYPRPAPPGVGPHQGRSRR